MVSMNQILIQLRVTCHMDVTLTVVLTRALKSLSGLLNIFMKETFMNIQAVSRFKLFPTDLTIKLAACHVRLYVVLHVGLVVANLATNHTAHFP